jgi:hypothetical protein
MRKFDFIERKEITGVDGFLNDLEKARRESANLGHTWYFRGDKKRTKLRPSIGNALKYAGKTFELDAVHEKALLNRFRRFAYQHLNGNIGEWEALFLARHYELPTRILDWSTNPLVALYFSCSPRDPRKPPGVVWGILRHPNEDHDIDIFNPTLRPLELPHLRPQAVKLIYPVYNSARLTAQKGVFTWHSHPKEPLDSLSNIEFECNKLDIIRLVKWQVSPQGYTKIVQNLERLGVSQRFIFPDLGGIAAGLWQTIVLWSQEQTGLPNKAMKPPRSAAKPRRVPSARKKRSPWRG